MVATSHRLLTPRDIARILFRHWQKMAVFFCDVIGLTLLVIAIYSRDPIRRSRSCCCESAAKALPLDPTATTGETIMLQKTQADEIASAINILTSRTVLERVAEQIGAGTNHRRPADAAATGATAASRPSASFAELRDFAGFVCQQRAADAAACRIRRPSWNWPFVNCSAAFRCGLRKSRR